MKSVSPSMSRKEVTGEWKTVRIQEKRNIEGTEKYVVKTNDLILPSTVFEIKSDWVEGGKKRILYDGTGCEICQLKTSKFSLYGTQKIKDIPTGALIASISRSGLLPIYFDRRGTLNVWKGSHGNILDLQVRGHYGGSIFPVIEVNSGGLIAEIKRKTFSLSKAISGTHVSFKVSYRCGLSPQVVLLLAIAIDDHFFHGL